MGQLVGQDDLTAGRGQSAPGVGVEDDLVAGGPPVGPRWAGGGGRDVADRRAAPAEEGVRLVLGAWDEDQDVPGRPRPARVEGRQDRVDRRHGLDERDIVGRPGDDRPLAALDPHPRHREPRCARRAGWLLRGDEPAAAGAREPVADHARAVGPVDAGHPVAHGDRHPRGRVGDGWDDVVHEPGQAQVAGGAEGRELATPRP